MSDYIKRKDAYMYIHAQYPQLLDAGVHLVINAIPAADVVEIEPGAWILTDYDGNTMKINGYNNGKKTVAKTATRDEEYERLNEERIKRFLANAGKEGEE